MSDPAGEPGPLLDVSTADAGRRLFRYLAGDEWLEYRAIMEVFAGTFFAEFTPDDVAAHLAAAGTALDPAVVAERLESLRGWGNLTVSSSVGNPSDLADYYRRRNRYLITRAGQEVHGLVEGVLDRVDEVRDVSTGRLRSLRAALAELDRHDADALEAMEPVRLADLVRAVFDPHAAFTDEISQFFAAINQWQSRYDLDDDELRFFADVLVGYVGERLDEIDRLSRPIGRHLESLRPRLPVIVRRAGGGLAERVERAGLHERVNVAAAAGASLVDWDRLADWFATRPGAPSRLDRLTREAVAAVRTLTMNLTRLSRVGVGASSRRADFLALAGAFHRTDPHDLAPLAAAALGLYSARHFGAVAADDGAPVPATTSWFVAPRAQVPVSIRERGDTTNRGSPTPIVDRSTQQEMVRRRREQERRARERIDAELLAAAGPDGRLSDVEVSAAALGRLQQLVGRSARRFSSNEHRERHGTEGGLGVLVRHDPDATTWVRTPEGVLTMRAVEVRIVPADVIEELSRAR